jgi:hypothetical protein
MPTAGGVFGRLRKFTLLADIAPSQGRTFLSEHHRLR